MSGQAVTRIIGALLQNVLERRDATHDEVFASKHTNLHYGSRQVGHDCSWRKHENARRRHQAENSKLVCPHALSIPLAAVLFLVVHIMYSQDSYIVVSSLLPAWLSILQEPGD